MKVVLLAGGFGTRISEESHLRPKPMVEIGGKPILWHIMNTILILVIMNLSSAVVTNSMSSKSGLQIIIYITAISRLILHRTTK